MAFLSWPEMARKIEEKRMVLLPCGSTEQHSTHLPLGTDTLTAVEVCRRVGERTGVPVAPALPYGMAGHHMSFPGSVTLSPVTYGRLVTEVCSSLFHHGVDRIVVVNAHGGNNRVLQESVNELYRAWGRTKLIAIVYCLGVLSQIMAEIRQYNLGHSDIRETSIMLAVKPQSVRWEKVGQASKLTARPTYAVVVRSVGQVEMDGGVVYLGQDTDEVTEAGGWGDVAGSTPELGHRILETLADFLVRFLEEFTRMKAPGRGVGSDGSTPWSGAPGGAHP